MLCYAFINDTLFALDLLCQGSQCTLTPRLQGSPNVILHAFYISYFKITSHNIPVFPGEVCTKVVSKILFSSHFPPFATVKPITKKSAFYL